jgi:DNA-binding beta-propeller fold protein YncE
MFPVASAVIALAFVALFALTARAQAAETIFWDNYTADPDNVAYANIDGTGGGVLNLSGTSDFEGPEGMAYDSVTNRLYVATTSSSSGHISYINLDGSGGGSFTAPGAPIEEPEGITLDPATRMIYWINTDPDTISWAKLDGSAGGVLNTAGADVEGAVRLAIDPVGGRLYWGANPSGNSTIEYANVNNTGGGQLDISGATEPEFVSGIAVDHAAGRVYWLDENVERVSFAGLAGGGGGDLNSPAAVFSEPYGLALDPSLGRLYWGNYGNGKVATGAIGFVGTNGSGGGGINIASAPVAGPQDPVIIKSPVGTGAPTVARDLKVRSTLSCTEGSWGTDFPGGFVYEAPRSFAFQWARNGAPIGGATATPFTAKSPGQYSCTVTAINQAGTGVQASAAINVKAAKIKLTTKKKAKAETGDLVKFKVKAVNQGDLKPKNAKLCVTLPKAAKDDLKAPKCKKAALQGRAKKTFTIKIKVKGGADLGTDKLTFKVKGAAGKAAKSKIVVK